MVTLHAADRISERMGLNFSSSKRMAQNALERGASADDLHTKEREYLRRQENKAGCTARFYNGFCFIFNSEGICITAYTAPKWFGKRPYYVDKKEIRNRKKYFQHYDIKSNKTEDIPYGI